MSSKSFYGRVVAPPTRGAKKGAGGEIQVTVPDGRGFITGSIRIGSKPRTALTGFSAPHEGGTSFQASGENTTGSGTITAMFLSVVVTGEVSPDGRTVSGTVLAAVNGKTQPDWSFVGAAEGVRLPSLPGQSLADGAIGSFDTEDMDFQEAEKPGILSRIWRGIPTPVKAAVGVGAAIGSIYLVKR